MNATARTLTPRLGIRLTGAALAALTTFSMLAAVSQSLHVGRLGEAGPMVQLERVTVTAQRDSAEPAVASIPTVTRAN